MSMGQEAQAASNNSIARLALAAMVVVAAGCTISRTGHFNSSARTSLQLRRTTVAEAIALLGDPRNLAKEEHDGNRLTLTYAATDVRLYGIFIGFGTRSLVLEFVDGILNGFDYTDGDAPNLDETALEQVRSIELSAFDAVALLGHPSGRAVCPSVLDKRCAQGEVWLYGYEDGRISVFYDAGQQAADIEIEVRGGIKGPFHDRFPFPPDGGWLEIGGATESDVIARLGQPNLARWNLSGWKTLSYSNAFVEIGHIVALFLSGMVLDEFVETPPFRMLDIELMEGRVYGYRYLSTGRGDMSPVPQRGLLAVGMTKAEVEQRVGRPQSEITCPSRLLQDCLEGSAWVWIGWREAHPEEPEDSRTPLSRISSLTLLFDNDSVLRRVND